MELFSYQNIKVTSVKLYNYKIIVEECEDGGFYAECPAFQGCHVEADTYEETMKEMKLALKNFIQDYQSVNQELPSDHFLVTSIQIAL